MKSRVALTFAFALLVLGANSQSLRDLDYERNTFGLGLGLDYGGIGTNFTTYPTKSFGIFGGLGYALAGAGFNVGLKYRFVSDVSFKKVAPYITGMYGYNLVIVVPNANQYNKFFYGPTIGFGVDFLRRPAVKGYWSLGLLIPLRGSDVDAYLRDLRAQGVVISDPVPIGISAGYRFKF